MLKCLQHLHFSHFRFELVRSDNDATTINTNATHIMNTETKARYYLSANHLTSTNQELMEHCLKDIVITVTVSYMII